MSSEKKPTTQHEQFSVRELGSASREEQLAFLKDFAMKAAEKGIRLSATVVLYGPENGGERARDIAVITNFNVAGVDSLEINVTLAMAALKSAAAAEIGSDGIGFGGGVTQTPGNA